MTMTLERGRESYFSEALFDQHNVIVLCGAAALSLSFASTWPLAVALGGECLWLALGPRSAKFRAFVDQRRREEHRARRATEVQPFVEKLDARAAARFAALEGLTESVMETAEERGSAPAELAALRSGLGRLASAFLEFGALHARAARAIAEIPFEELQAELARSAQLFAVERNLETRVALRQEQKAIQRRLLQRDQLMQVEHAAGLKLGAIENGLGYLRSRALIAVTAGQLAAEAEVLLGQIGSPAGLESTLRDERSPEQHA